MNAERKTLNAERQEKNANIDDRALDYALRVIRLHQHLNKIKNGAASIISKQYLRSATSIGANLAEARAAETRPDFIHKCAIAQKEVRECGYWLNLLARSELVPQSRLQPLINETNELTAIITTIIVNTKKGRNSQL